MTQAVPTASCFDLRNTGDTNPRINIQSNGTVNLGGGVVGTDVTLYRSAADVLKTDDSLIVGTNLTVTGTGTVGGQAIVVTNDARLSDTRTPTDNTVTSAKIVDNSIVLADINSALQGGANANFALRQLGFNVAGQALPSTASLSDLQPAINNLSMGGNYITGLPVTAPPAADYAVSKGYVDTVATGLDPKASVRIASTANLGPKYASGY